MNTNTDTDTNTTHPRGQRRFNLRACITLLTALVFLVMAWSGVILYLAPRGRVANWTNWSVLGLDKDQWSNLHMTAAVLMLLAVGWHVYNNWKPLCHHVKSRLPGKVLRCRELFAAAAVVLLLVTGTILGLAPFRYVEAMNVAVKDGWESRVGSVGRAPSTYVQEASAAEFAQRMGMSLESLQHALLQLDVVLDDPQTPMESLARQHGVSLQRIYDLVRAETDRTHATRSRDADTRNRQSSGISRGTGLGDRSRDGGGAGAGRGEGGFGRLTLADYCRSEGLSTAQAVQIFNDHGIEAGGDQRLRDLAARMEMTPRELAQWLAKQ